MDNGLFLLLESSDEIYLVQFDWLNTTLLYFHLLMFKTTFKLAYNSIQI